MKYFTMAWWVGVQDGDFTSPSDEYQTYLTAIREQIPRDLLTLQETVSLHDSRLRELDYSTLSNSLDMKLDGSDENGEFRQFHLHYSGIASFRTTANPSQGLGGPHGYGDWGYDEADVTSDSKIEHRILFSSGIEFQIVFEGFELSWSDAKGSAE